MPFRRVTRFQRNRECAQSIYGLRVADSGAGHNYRLHMSIIEISALFYSCQVANAASMRNYVSR